MPMKVFEWEYIRDKVFERGEVIHSEEVAQLNRVLSCRAVFRAEDSRFYEFQYSRSSNGWYSFDDWAPDEEVSCPEVQKEVITIEKWLTVPDATVTLK